MKRFFSDLMNVIYAAAGRVLCMVGWHQWVHHFVKRGEGYWSWIAGDGTRCGRCGKVR